MEATLRPPFRVLTPSAHDCGKTFLLACLTNWWYDTRDPGVVLTTAPTKREVVDLLWAEVRLQRRAAGLPSDFIGDRGPEMRSGDEHWAKGWTAAAGEGFQGRHRPRMLFLLDEAIGVRDIFWTTLKTMFDPGGQHAVVACFNPTATSSAAYAEYQKAADGYPERGWHVIHLDAREHPNVLAELRGERAPIPGAVSLAMMNDWVSDWCTEIDPADKTEMDFFWGGKCWKPGPIFECRGAGAWPTQSTGSVWPNYLWKIVEKSRGEIHTLTIPEIGCDPARFGDDFTSIHVRDFAVSMHHETHNGWDGAQTVGRLKMLCKEAAEYCRRKCRDLKPEPEEIRVKVDCDGMGGLGIVDHRGDFNFIGVSSAARVNPDFENRRSELWFNTVDLARKGLANFGRLPTNMLALLRAQAVAPIYWLNTAGQLVVERKEDTKKRLKRSPDDMDALALAYFTAPELTDKAPIVEDAPRDPLGPKPGEQPRMFARVFGTQAKG